MKSKNVLLAIFIAITLTACASQPATQARTAPEQTPATPAPTPVAQTPAQQLGTGLADLDVAVREASNYLNNNLTAGNKLMILYIQSDYPALSEYIIDEFIANTVNDRVFSVVDRRQLDAIRAEMVFQMSGEVDDESAQRVGRLLGANTIISGAVSKIGEVYRMRVRALDVETARIEGQFNRNIPDGPAIEMLAGSAATGTGAVAPAASAQVRSATPAPTAVTAQPISAPPVTSPMPTHRSHPAPVKAEPAIQGTIVPGGSLAEKLAWLSRSADSHNTYIVEVNADERIAPHTFEYRGAINITIVLQGVGANQTIRLSSHGRIFTIRPNVTLVLDNNITLQGHRGNAGAMVDVLGGMLKMNVGAAIIDNLIGVYVQNGIFEMSGGTISGNSDAGVWIPSGNFTMTGGTISGNSGVGGGVVVGQGNASFTMTGGTIYANTCKGDNNRCGGGVEVASGATFIMRGGIISGNSAITRGGGVCVTAGGTFTKTGGIITGYSSDVNNGNVVKDENGIIARRGHAVFFRDNIRKETTAGPEENLSIDRRGSASGAWD